MSQHVEKSSPFGLVKTSRTAVIADNSRQSPDPAFIYIPMISALLWAGIILVAQAILRTHLL
jgi:hypothetical protein